MVEALGAEPHGDGERTLAVVAEAQGDRARAVGLGRAALQLAHDLNNPLAIAWCVQVAVRLSA